MLETYIKLKKEEQEILKKDMSKHQRELLEELIKDEEKQSNMTLNDLLFEFDTEFIQKLLDIEMDIYVKENKEGNRRNGYIKQRNLLLGGKEVSFNRPRARHEKEFDSVILPKRRRILDDIRDFSIIMYSQNMSLKQIEILLKGILKVKVSTSLISELISEISTEVYAWRTRKLERCYFCLNIDCTYIDIRDNKNLGKHKVPVYIAVGTTLKGKKEILGMYLGNEDAEKNIIDELHDVDIGESKAFWREIFGDLKDRGVEEVLFVSSDGLVGLQEAIEEDFKGCKYQRCIVHLARNIYKLVTKKESVEVMENFKKIYEAKTNEEGTLALNDFIEKYKNKKVLVNTVQKYYEYIKPLYNYPEGIRNYVYTNNIVESVNSVIKRGFYGRGALPNTDSALNIVYVNIKQLEEKWKKSKVRNWDKISNELIIIYKDKLEKYL